ncbi:hypothetical protein OPV22_031170 [Ensete ventricosum]|uniref:t-SNARE coiled-coil homology domain-containing protein n=1 Tax=Ensete ventricosum TaxID=4639 RepID=A0AAV8PIQ9_ENSVE|nr:hypothetical protein OPV22_031170 [Ensete ventricosum]
MPPIANPKAPGNRWERQRRPLPIATSQRGAEALFGVEERGRREGILDRFLRQRAQKRLAILNKRTKGGCSCMCLLLSVVAIVILIVVAWLLIKYL